MMLENQPDRQGQNHQNATGILLTVSCVYNPHLRRGIVFIISDKAIGLRVSE